MRTLLPAVFVAAAFGSPTVAIAADEKSYECERGICTLSCVSEQKRWFFWDKSILGSANVQSITFSYTGSIFVVRLLEKQGEVHHVAVANAALFCTMRGRFQQK